MILISEDVPSAGEEEPAALETVPTIPAIKAPEVNYTTCSHTPCNLILNIMNRPLLTYCAGSGKRNLLKTHIL